MMTDQEIKKTIWIPISQLHKTEILVKQKENYKEYQHQYYLNVTKPKRQSKRKENKQ